MLSLMNGVGRSAARSSSAPQSTPLFALPPYFPWTPDFSIFEHGDGSFSIDYSPANDKPSGTTYTVDVVSGDDTTGDGSTGAPFQTLQHAYDQGADVINIKSGWVDADTGFNANFNPVRDLAIVAVDGVGSVHWTRSEPQSNLTWVQESSPNTSVYKASGISGIRNVVDLTYGRDGTNAILDTQVDGSSYVPIPYSEQSNIADVQANAGSFYDDGADIYVHTHDGRAPDSDLRLLRSENINNLTGDITYYIEGIEIWGDRTLNFNISGANTSKFIGVDMACRFTSDGNDCFNFDDLADIRLVRCVASDNSAADGFNYHRIVGSDEPFTRILEFSCAARRNGSTDSSNDNGSTTHDRVHCIRMNGVYEENYGPNVADTAGSHVINLNCQSLNSLAASSSKRNGFLSGTYSAGEPTVSYLKNCTSTGNTFARLRSTGGQMIELGGFSGDSDDSGSVLDGADPFFMAVGALAPNAINGFYCVLDSEFFVNNGGEVDQLYDSSPFKNNLSTPGTRPDYDAVNVLAGGQPAIDFGTALNSDIFAPAKSSTVKEVIIACSYKDGADTAFDDFNTIMANSAGDNYILCDSGGDALYTAGSAAFAEDVSVNGGVVSATMLPSGFAVFRFTGASAVTDSFYYFGRISRTNRGWQGPVGLLLTSERDLTGSEYSALLSAIQTKFSIS